MSAANVAAASARGANVKHVPTKGVKHLLRLNRLNNKRMKPLLTKLNQQPLLLPLLRQPQPLRSACPKSGPTICHWRSCRMWRNLQACNGSIPTLSVWRKSKRRLPPNRARRMYRASALRLWCWTKVR